MQSRLGYGVPTSDCHGRTKSPNLLTQISVSSLAQLVVVAGLKLIYPSLARCRSTANSLSGDEQFHLKIFLKLSNFLILVAVPFLLFITFPK